MKSRVRRLGALSGPMASPGPCIVRPLPDAVAFIRRKLPCRQCLRENKMRPRRHGPSPARGGVMMQQRYARPAAGAGRWILAGLALTSLGLGLHGAADAGSALGWA